MRLPDLNRPNPGPARIKLHGVPEGTYQAPDGSLVAGNDLMRAGVPLSFPPTDFASCVMVFEKRD